MPRSARSTRSPGQGWLLRGAAAGSPLLSVITIVRRDAHGLRETRASLEAAGFRDFEHVIIEGDGAQPADMAALARAWASRPDLSWCVEPDGGVYDAMNRGLMAARGEWVWFLNAGDRVHPACTGGRIEAMLADATCDWVVASARIVDHQGQPQREKRATGYTRASLRSGIFTPCHQAVFARRLAMASIGGFDTGFRIAADYDVFLALDNRSAPKVVDLVVADYLSGGLSDTQRAASLREYAVARSKRLTRQRRASAADLARTEVTVLTRRARSRWRARREA